MGFAVAVFAVTLGAMVTPQLVTSSQLEPLIATATAPASDQIEPPGTANGDASAPDVRSDDPDDLPDFYGNDVAPAVAKYRLDATGSLYELHSPQTELPRLGSPKS